MADLTMKRGDTRTVIFTFAGGSTFETGDVVRFTAKLSHDDADADAVVALASSDGTITLDGNTATGEIPSSATSALPRIRRLYYDWQLTSAGGKTRTLDEGSITVTPDITRTP